MTIKSKVKSKVKSKSLIKPKSNLVKNSLITTGILGSLATVGLFGYNKMKKDKEQNTKNQEFDNMTKEFNKKLQLQEESHKKQIEILNNKIEMLTKELNNLNTNFLYLEKELQNNHKLSLGYKYYWSTS